MACWYRGYPNDKLEMWHLEILAILRTGPTDAALYIRAMEVFLANFAKPNGVYSKRARQMRAQYNGKCTLFEWGFSPWCAPFRISTWVILPK